MTLFHLITFFKCQFSSKLHLTKRIQTSGRHIKGDSVRQAAHFCQNTCSNTDCLHTIKQGDYIKAHLGTEKNCLNVRDQILDETSPSETLRSQLRLPALLCCHTALSVSGKHPEWSRKLSFHHNTCYHQYVEVIKFHPETHSSGAASQGQTLQQNSESLFERCLCSH